VEIAEKLPNEDANKEKLSNCGQLFKQTIEYRKK
jgi:hypothetical protein